MADEVIAVIAVPGGWQVEASFSEGPLIFRSGARAEQAGRRLAQAALASGLTVEFSIHTRDGQLAGQASYGRRADARGISRRIDLGAVGG